MITTMSRTDCEVLEFLVLQELKWDSNVDETGIEAQVRNGIVTLTGTVGTNAQKIIAQEAARRVAGVLDVANNIQVVLLDK